MKTKARILRYIMLAVVGVVALVGCRDTEPGDTRLRRVGAIVSDRPEAAIAALDSIDAAKLGESDRQYYNFLSVKANDKAYVTHTSDSLILTLVDYYDGTALYPEVLYYAGRVYSDLGDLPTALEYFQKGLDQLPDTPTDSADIHLKGNLLSQTGRLLNELRLYSEAIPYLEKAIEIDKIERDTFNIAYDNELLGYIYLSQNNLPEAENRFKIAFNYSHYLSESDKAHMQI